MEERIDREAPPAEAGVLWAATYVLTGLRYPRAITNHLLQGVRAMRESVTWWAIFEEGEEKGKAEGKVEGVRETLLLQGTKRFGPADAATEAALAAITDPTRLRELTVRLLDLGGWQELLPPAPKPRRGRKRPGA
jgi:predicted transposase YdaD